MSLASFPTVFPSDAASKIGQAILAKKFTTDLIEPIYDLLGFGLFKLFGSSAPFPNPVPAPVKPTFGEGIDDHEAVGNMLLAAADSHRNGEMLVESGAKAAPNLTALPWGTIISVLITILQGLLLGVSPSPIPNPVPNPTPAPAPE